MTPRSLLLAALLAAACAGRQPAAPTHPKPLDPSDPKDIPTPPPVPENRSAPGDQPSRPRAYPGAPPTIPHLVADFVPITPSANGCIDCHSVKEKKAGEATPIPASHYEDLRNAPGKRSASVIGARYVCTACHVEHTSAAPLVGNAFKPSR